MFDWLTHKKKPSTSPEHQDDSTKVSSEAAPSNSHEHDGKPTKADPELQKYLADAVRNTNHPDHLWEYRDPMARKPGQVLTNDPTNTGA